MGRRRVLFVAEAATLAHVARLVALANSLDPAAYQVRLATDLRYSEAIGSVGFDVVPLRTMPSAQFFRAISRGDPIFDAATLSAYVEEDLRVIGEFKPDVIVGDFRVSLGISARVGKVFYVNLTNAYWSPYARVRWVVPEITLTRAVGARMGQMLFDLSRRTVLRFHAVPVNKVRRQFGLPALPPDFRYALTDGDTTLYADVPELIPTEQLPPSHRFIGPVYWSAPVPLPPWWPDAIARQRQQPAVYVTLGSSGPREVLERVLDALATLPVTAIVSAAGSYAGLRSPSNAFVASYLPGHEAAKLASLVVCNGGSPTAYQGLALARPVLGLASNMDQFLNMSAVEHAGCGRLLRSRCSVPQIRSAARSILQDLSVTDATEKVAQVLGRYSALDAVRHTLGEIFG